MHIGCMSARAMVNGSAAGEEGDDKGGPTRHMWGGGKGTAAKEPGPVPKQPSQQASAALDTNGNDFLFSKDDVNQFIERVLARNHHESLGRTEGHTEHDRETRLIKSIVENFCYEYNSPKAYQRWGIGQEPKNELPPLPVREAIRNYCKDSDMLEYIEFGLFDTDALIRQIMRRNNTEPAMSTLEVIVFLGNSPGSGKSTFAQKFRTKNQKTRIVSSDTLHQVKVSRKDPGTGKNTEVSIDLVKLIPEGTDGNFGMERIRCKWRKEDINYNGVTLKRVFKPIQVPGLEWNCSRNKPDRKELRTVPLSLSLKEGLTTYLTANPKAQTCTVAVAEEDIPRNYEKIEYGYYVQVVIKTGDKKKRFYCEPVRDHWECQVTSADENLRYVVTRIHGDDYATILNDQMISLVTNHDRDSNEPMYLILDRNTNANNLQKTIEAIKTSHSKIGTEIQLKIKICVPAETTTTHLAHFPAAGSGRP